MGDPPTSIFNVYSFSPELALSRMEKAESVFPVNSLVSNSAQLNDESMRQAE